MFYFEKTCKKDKEKNERKKNNKKKHKKTTHKKQQQHKTYFILFSLNDKVLNISVSEHLNIDKYFQ
jgi:hypothetical protein